MRLLPKFVLIAGLVALTVACGGSSRPSGEDSTVQSEAITVHGDWRVAIHNEDGSLDREYVFANALREGAGDLLGQLLLVNATDPADGYPRPVLWAMTFGETDLDARPQGGGIVLGVGPCANITVLPVPGSNSLLTRGCLLNPLYPGTGNPVPVVTAIPGGIRISGSATATQQGDINYVETQLYIAIGEGSQTGNAFTGTSVGPFEDILPGQTIQVQVDITFASPAAP